MITIKVNPDKALAGLKNFVFNAVGEASHSLQQLAVETLEGSNDACPYETGELRNSGRLRMRSARYSKGLTVAKVQGAGPSGGGHVSISDDYIGFQDPNSYFFQGVISYSRLNPIDGWDIAVYMHENLYPKGHKRAKQKGTRGKYLEDALMRRKPWLTGRIREGVNLAIKQIRK